MPDSMLWNKQAKKCTLTLQFEEGDDVLAGVESAMKEHNIGEASLLELTGNIKEGSGNFVRGHTYNTFEFRNTPVKIATGHFKRRSDGLFCVLKIVPANGIDHVTVSRAIAASDLVMKLSYYDFTGIQ